MLRAAGPGSEGGSLMQAEERAERALEARQAAVVLNRRDVRAVALTYVDNAGITRVKTVPLDRLEHVAAWGVGMSPVFDVFGVDDSITTSAHIGGPDGDLRLMPVVDRLTLLAAQSGWAWAPVDRLTQDGEVYPGCQRSFARRMVARAAARGIEAKMAFEVEWIIGADGPDGGFVPAAPGPAYGMTRIIERSDYCRDVLALLDRQGVAVEQFHPEYAPGQYEVSVAASDPVGAADVNVLVRQTVRAVGERHGVATSFAPSVVAGEVGNGSHLHLSLWRGGRNLFTGGPGESGCTAEGESFLAGVLDRLPELVGVSAPSVASHVRMAPSRWAGVYQVWGVENREAALRIVPGTVGTREWSANAEIKCVDGSANPYLVVGSVLALGLADLDEGRTLPPPVVGDPAARDPAELSAAGIRRLPLSAADALDHLAASGILREAMGDPLFEAFLAVRRAEIDAAADRSPEDVVAATRWRY